MGSLAFPPPEKKKNNKEQPEPRRAPTLRPTGAYYACRWILALLPARGRPFRSGPTWPSGPFVFAPSVTCSVLGLPAPPTPHPPCVIRAGTGSVIFGVSGVSPGGVSVGLEST